MLVALKRLWAWLLGPAPETRLREGLLTEEPPPDCPECWPDPHDDEGALP